jgi:diguanylate cyclase (GGDEF)-like protein/PAS domain S-box-containing protein
LVALADEDQLWLKACHGLDIEEGRKLSFCAHALGSGIMVVPDTTQDPRFHDTPLVAGKPIRFYAGAPLITADGFKLGALCLIDTNPRGLDMHQQAALPDLAAMVAGELELHLAEAALTESEERYRIVAETASDAIITIDEESRILYVNGAATRIFGYAEEEILGQNLTMLMPDYLRHAHEAGLARYVETGRRHLTWEAVELPGLHRSGAEIPIEISYGEFVSEGRRRFTGIIRDISERKRIQEQLQRSSEQVTEILESISDTFFSLDSEWRFTYLNASAEQLLGQPREALLGCVVWEAFPEMVETVFCQQAHEAVTNGEPASFEEYYLPQDTWFEVHMYPAQGGLSIYLRNINDRKRIEQAEQLARRELEQQVQARTAELQRANEQLLHDAFHDALTGLPNRALFLDRLGQAIERSKRHVERRFAVLFLDFDRFKVINDSLGHTIGDALLTALGRRLKPCLRPADTLARLGGDEFTILLEDITCLDDATKVAERIGQALLHPFVLHDHEIHISASIGIVGESGYAGPNEALRDADIAMYRAKSLGKARYEVFDRAMRERALALMTLESDLRLALGRGQLQVHYQPIVEACGQQLVGFEALVRWQHPKHGIISPAEFISLAEETGLIIEIDRWVLAEACRQVRFWQDEFPTCGPVTLSVNLSSQQFIRPDLAAYVKQTLQDTGFAAANLKLEITETLLMNSSASVNEVLEHLRELGVQLYIDDFGTGYSSLSYLQRFSTDTLKIDRSFISKMSESEESAELVRTIISMAHNLGMQVVAEGIETAEQLASLRELRCEYAQGYLFAKPLEPTQAAEFLATSQASTLVRPLAGQCGLLTPAKD